MNKATKKTLMICKYINVKDTIVIMMIKSKNSLELNRKMNKMEKL